LNNQLTIITITTTTIPMLVLMNLNSLLVVRKIGLASLKSQMLATKRLLNVGNNHIQVIPLKIVKPLTIYVVKFGIN